MIDYERELRAQSARTKLLVVMLGALTFSSFEATQVEAQIARNGAIAQESNPTARHRLFERRVSFSPTYLSRIFAAARDGERVAARRATEAFTYAVRYDIPEDLAFQVLESALAEGVDPDLAFRLVRVESVFEPHARGPNGALGLTQLMPSTARAIDNSLRTEEQILEPATNLRTGFRYLRRLIERYRGDVRLGLLAYNRGEGTVDRALRGGRDPENGYSRRVLGVTGEFYTGSGLLEESGE